MRFGVNQNLNKVKNKTATTHPPLRFSGVGKQGEKKSDLLGSLGGGLGDERDETKKGDYSLPIFVGTTILGMLVLEFTFSRKEGVKSSC